MSWELAVVIAGTAVQIFGVIVTIKGAREVWRDVATPDDRFLAPLIQVRRWTVARLRRAVGRPAPQVVGVGAASIVAIGSRVRAYTSPGPLSEGLTADEAVRVVSEQLRDNIAKIYATIFALDDELASKIDEAKAAQTSMRASLDTRTEEERRRAVRGLRTEAYGFLFLTFGTLIQTGGTLAGFGS